MARPGSWDVALTVSCDRSGLPITKRGPQAFSFERLATDPEPAAAADFADLGSGGAQGAAAPEQELKRVAAEQAIAAEEQARVELAVIVDEIALLTEEHSTANTTLHEAKETLRSTFIVALR